MITGKWKIIFFLRPSYLSGGGEGEGGKVEEKVLNILKNNWHFLKMLFFW